MKKKRYLSRQVRRAAERRRAKQLAQKERERKGNQKQEKPQEPDQPERKKIDWKLASGIIGAIVGIIGTIVKVAEFIRDTFF